jgi:hypothetical protein
MDWKLAIERNRGPLLRIVASLIAVAGLSERLRVPVYRAILAVLRPAESAVRRLVVIAAQGMVMAPAQECVARTKSGVRGKRPPRSRVCFRLFDPRKRFGQSRPHYVASDGSGFEPRIHGFDVDPLSPLFRAGAMPVEKPERLINSQSLSRRLVAIKSALEDLPRQAKRYVRWRARPLAERRPKLFSPYRPGTPPGYRKRPVHEVHDILKECHTLVGILPEVDTG